VDENVHKKITRFLPRHQRGGGLRRDADHEAVTVRALLKPALRAEKEQHFSANAGRSLHCFVPAMIANDLAPNQGLAKRHLSLPGPQLLGGSRDQFPDFSAQLFDDLILYE
jgi:hypothetical protein